MTYIKNSSNPVMPFIWAGLVLMFFIVGIVFLLHVIVIAALVGLVFFGISKLRSKFFAPQQDAQSIHTSPDSPHQENSGRIIEHDEIQ